MRRKNPKRKTLYTKGKKRLLKILGKKRLNLTKAGRRSEREAMKQVLGYAPPKLSEAVGRKVGGRLIPGKASRYTVKGKRLIFEVEKERRPGERVARRDIFGDIKTDVWGEPVYDYSRDREVVVRKKLVGEKLIVKRVHKGGGGKKGSSRGEGAVRHGTAAAVRQRAKTAGHKKAAKKGKRARREKMKKKKR